MKDIIFDVDGTLWDTTDVVAKAWNQAVASAGIEAKHITGEILKREFGKPMNVIAEDLFPELTQEERERIMEFCCEYEHSYLEACEEDLCYEGMRDTFITLSGKCRVCIVSNCQSGYIEQFLRKTNLEAYVTDIECYGNTKKSKGMNIKAVIERNQLTDPVYVGDTAGDCEASGEAGVPFIFAAYGFGAVSGTEKIDHIADLLNFIE